LKPQAIWDKELTGPIKRKVAGVTRFVVSLKIKKGAYMSTDQMQTSLDEQIINDAVTELLDAFPPSKTKPVVFLGEQYDRGLAWVHFPVGSGGLGLSPKHQKIVSER